MTTEAEVAEFLAAARRGLSPTSADEARIRRLTEVTLRAGARAGGSAAVASGASRARPWLGRLLALGAVAATAAGLGYRAGWRAGRSDALAPAADELRAAAVSAPTSAAPGASVDPVHETSPAAPVPVVRPPLRSPAHRRSPSPEVTPDAASLAEEVRVLRSTERALRENKPGFALALLRELDRAVPTGALTEERQAMRTIARCASGEVPFGVNLAQDFAEHYPASVYGRRVEQACATTDSAGSGDQSSRRKSP